MYRLTEYSMYGQYCNFINAAINSWNTPLLHFVTSFVYNLHQWFTIHLESYVDDS